MERWQTEGLPINVDLSDSDKVRAWCLEFFGFEGIYSAYWGNPRIPVNTSVYPGSREEVLEETGAYRP
jgi:hypothetical protein